MDDGMYSSGLHKCLPCAAETAERASRGVSNQDIAREFTHRSRRLGHVRGVAPGPVEDGFDDGEHGPVAHAVVAHGRAVDKGGGGKRTLDELGVAWRGGSRVSGVLRRLILPGRRRRLGK